MAYHRVYTMGATSGAGTANLLELMSSHPVSVGFLLLDFQFYVCFVCPFALFLLTIVMSVLITLLVSANSSQ
jgi:hypothetical protein